MIQNDQRRGPLPSEIYATQSADRMAKWRKEGLEETAQIREKLRSSPAEPGLYAELASLYSVLGDQDAAAAVLREGIAACGSAADLYWKLITMLQEAGRNEDAIALATSAIRKAPKGLQFRFIQRLILPIIYDNEEEIVAYRRRYIRGLKACEKEILSANAKRLEEYLEGLKHFTTFQLPYQGCSDVALQRQYGILVHHILKAHYPQWSSALSMPDVSPDGRIRVGFTSRHFFNHTVARLFLGWMENCDRNQFQIYLYHSASREDSMTKRVRESSDVFLQTRDFESLCMQIRKDQLHILIFTDIGMASKTTMLAALRLAPVQCMTWGHPVTSGLPTVDYFLSSELMEPPAAQEHYSERLVLLPGIGICVDKPPVPRAILTKSRAAWGIPEDAVVYLCCQSLFKYLPRYDHIFPAIAREVAKAKFVFFARSDMPTARFQARLQRVFSTNGLCSDDYCLMLPTQPRFDYWNLNLVCDVFLDSLGWSGGMTTLDAIACGLPIVTLPREFMRGRHSYAILTQLGVTDTIASSESDYVRIAARLGLDTAWRKHLVRRMAEKFDNLYSDLRSVRALEDLIQRVVATHRAAGG